MWESLLRDSINVPLTRRQTCSLDFYHNFELFRDKLIIFLWMGRISALIISVAQDNISTLAVKADKKYWLSRDTIKLFLKHKFNLISLNDVMIPNDPKRPQGLQIKILTSNGPKNNGKLLSIKIFNLPLSPSTIFSTSLSVSSINFSADSTLAWKKWETKTYLRMTYR